MPTAREGHGRTRGRGTAAGPASLGSRRAALPSATSAVTAVGQRGVGVREEQAAEFADRLGLLHRLVDQQAHRREVCQRGDEQFARRVARARGDAPGLRKPRDGVGAASSSSRRRRTAERHGGERFARRRAAVAAASAQASCPRDGPEILRVLAGQLGGEHAGVLGLAKLALVEMTCSRSAVMPSRARSRRSSSADLGSRRAAVQVRLVDDQEELLVRVCLPATTASCRRPAVPAAASACTRASSSS